MKIMAERDKCEGHGMCEAMAPEYFAVGEDDTVVVLDEQPPEDRRTDLTAAVAACPVLALHLLT